MWGTEFDAVNALDWEDQPELRGRKLVKNKVMMWALAGLGKWN